MVINSLEQDGLLQGLIALGCRIERIGDSTIVFLPDQRTSFLFERIDSWIHLGSTFLRTEDLVESKHIQKLQRFLLELQHRCLGCRFSFDDDGLLAIGADVYPSHQHPEDLLLVMEQIDFVGNVVLPLCQHVLCRGKLPTATEIDEVFGITDQ
jgi:hypothetical protein